MLNITRSIRQFGLYLLPASLLTTAGVLLAALLCYPAPSTQIHAEPGSAASADEDYWRSHADAMFAALLADALRQMRAERQTQARTLMYRYQPGASSGERPVGQRMAPPMIEHGDDADRPILIRL